MTAGSPALTRIEAPLLVEASAGTGKTHTITTFFVRAIVEDGLEPKHILVVTYTKAATAELRARARSRILGALARLRAPSEQADDLDEVLSNATAKAGAEVVEARLRSALGHLDEAAIMTIHGFCQRLLRDHPLHFGVDFELEVIEDLSPVHKELATDFWATDLYERPEWLVRALTDKRIDPERLASLAKTATMPGVGLIGPAPQEADARKVEQVLDLHRRAAALWFEHRTAVLEILLEHDGFDRNKYRKTSIEKKWIPGLDDFFTKRGLRFPPDFFEKLAQGKMGIKKRCEEPGHVFFQACAALLEAHEALEPMVDYQVFDFQRRFLEFVGKQTERRKRETAVFSFDDLLNAVYAPLDPESKGFDATSVAEAVAREYPVALVDEFQDTDSIQYGIFKAIYGEGRIAYVGDPKQAIYAFRGADVFSYLTASRDVGDSELKLRENRRSDPSLVRAVNTLFSRREPPFVLEGIRFDHARAHSLADDSSLKPAMELVMIDESDLEGSLQSAVAPIVANEIAHLLTSNEQIAKRAVTPGDVAVLCRSNRQALAVTRALRALKVPTSLDGDSSVLDTEVAHDLRAVLEAALMPGDSYAVRRALLTSLISMSPYELATLDDATWSQWVLDFQRWHETWHQYGVVRFLEEMLQATEAERRIASRQTARRDLTDLLHLEELLMRGERERKRDPVALLQWFRRLDEGNTDGGMVAYEDLQQRADADEHAVRVSTIHKSKGLEYEIVYCPFTWNDASLWTEEKENLKFHDDEGRIQVDLGSARKDEHEEKAAEEKLSEAVRLLYVATTRAKRQCVLFWGRAKGWKSSALAFLLHGDDVPDKLSQEEMGADVERLVRESDGTIGSRPPRLERAEALPELGSDRKLEAREEARGYDLSPRITSFTSLTGHDEKTPGPRSAEPEEGSAPLFSELPGGTRTGLLLHSILERIDFAAVNSDEARGIVEAQLRAYGLAQELAPSIQRDLLTVVATPLADEADAPRLVDLEAERGLRELEFTLDAGRPNVEGLAELFRKYRAPAAAPEYPDRLRSLRAQTLQSYLRGYIDLMFEWKGRWYVADYKSNTLPSYDDAALTEAVQREHYLLQAQLYTAAAQRYLRLRLPEYDPATDWGGAMFLFLRGMGGEGPRSSVFFDRQPPELLNEVDQWLGGRHGSG